MNVLREGYIPFFLEVSSYSQIERAAWQRICEELLSTAAPLFIISKSITDIFDLIERYSKGDIDLFISTMCESGGHNQ
jgi:hypothetical protein